MSRDLMPFNNRLNRTEPRQLRRARSNLAAQAGVEMARIQHEAELQAMRADAVTYVGKRAMQDVAMLSQLEQQLVTMVPMASGRLQAIADMTCLAVAEVVSDTLRKVR